MKRLRALWARVPRETVRYAVAGVATTAVNFVIFALLTKLFGVRDRVANIVSISAAIVFAYVVNRRFVFRSGVRGFGGVAAEFGKFVGGRLLSMAVEYWGYIAVFALLRRELLAKASTQVVVFVLNYVISRIFVFERKKGG
ncbi:MAG: GtrA family protein [Oscillospiraceae bacterium]|jgi:putative flippase GtrA|nr:GtrA family protein [Oscillospiraceae bacterium]